MSFRARHVCHVFSNYPQWGMPNLSKIAPELPVLSVPKSIEYYEVKLGFHTTMTMPDGDYAIVERDDVAIHLFQSGNGHSAPGSIHIFTEGLDELHSELQKRGAHIKQDIIRKPWGNRDFRVIDDSGNEIKFTEPLQKD
jgi:uncharacterized glyoxalase superfamily protein PhnB